jgi:uncharacterized protein (TIGR02099 family)
MLLRKAGKILLCAVAAVMGVSLLLLLAVKLTLDRVPRYQAEIKDWVHERSGYHIAFASVSPTLRWYGPELYFDQLELRSADDRRVLVRAVGGRIGADLWQFFRDGRPYAGRVELDAPTIDITRTGPGEFALAPDIVFGGGTASPPALRLDALPAGTLTIRHGIVSIRRWNAELPQLTLHEVNLRLQRAGDGIKLALGANLPAALGGSVNLNVTASGAGAFDSLRWTALGRARELSFAGWHELLPDYLKRLGSGAGGFDVAARGKGGSLSYADLEFDAANVTAQLTDEPSVKFDQLAGTLTITHAGELWTLQGRRLRASRGGRRDPDSNFDASWRDAGGLLALKASASYLRAEALLPLAGLLPQKDLRERLQEIAPTGEWQDMRVDLHRADLKQPLDFEVQARFRGVGFAPSGRGPGLRGLNGTLAGNQSGGRVDLDTQQAVFAWPAELPHPVAVVNLKTTLYWKRTAEEVLVATPSLDLATPDGSMHALVAWHQPADGVSPLLTLAASVDDGDVASIGSYLPRVYVAPAALAWLDRAFVAGRMPHADVVIQGPIRHYPFRDGSGLFLARAHLQGLTLDYQEGWPVAENLSVLAEFRNEGLRLQLGGGHIGNLTLASGKARIADFNTAELELHTLVQGDAADALGYLRATPIDAAAEHVFSSVEAQGPMSADVDLYLPFRNFDHRHTLVSAHLDGVSLNCSGSSLAATDLSGDADVDGAQVARADLRGKLLGGTFQMTARSPRNRPVTRTLLLLNGNLTGEALHSALSLPASIPIGGTTEWHAVFKMSPDPARERSLRINSSLAGLDLNLPDPLAKPVGEGLPTAVDVDWPAAGGEQVRVAFGSVLRAQFNVDSGANGPTLGRAAVTFGMPSGTAEPPPFSESQQLNTGGTIDRLDLAGWLKLYTPDKGGKPLGNFLRTAQFEVAQIDYLGLSFMDVALDVAVTDSGWRIGIDGPNVTGSISLPSPADSGEPWKLEFKRLKFVDGPATPGLAPVVASTGRPGPTAGTAAVTAAAAGGLPAANPHGVPPIDFHAADMIWGDRHFGDVRATLTRLDDGIGLRQLSVTGPNFAANAKGEWRGKDAGTARLSGTLSSTDVGATMKELGYDPVIQAKSGNVEFDLSWQGAPSTESLAMAKGQVQVAFEKGQLTGISPGAGRVLGLASFAALPRHLSLDFSDLTDKGFAFDTIRGDFELHDGSAYTDDVLVNGPAAEIGLIGRIGLKNKDYDQTVAVTGNVSSTLPLAAFVAGPVVGGAVLLFSQVFKQPLKGLARGYYRITGSWDNPTVERIKSADAAAATAEATK